MVPVDRARQVGRQVGWGRGLGPTTRITYIGHATLLIEMGGMRVLTDPNFDRRLAGVLPRVSAPGIPLASLPPIDAVLLTHAHADHLSFRSLDALPAGVPVLAPPAVCRWLRRRGTPGARAIAPGEAVTLDRLTIRADRAAHMGSRYGIDRWRGAANMYLLDAGDATVFFAGDTGLTPRTHHLAATAARRLDVALLPIGDAPWWKPGFRRGHLSSDDALTLFERLGARYFIPYHWGTFHHVTSGPFDARRRLDHRLRTYPRRDAVVVLEPGEVFAHGADGGARHGAV